MNFRSFLPVASLTLAACGGPTWSPEAPDTPSHAAGPIVATSIDAGDLAGYDCAELEDCYQQCPPTPQATLEQCRATCYASANPTAQRLGDALSHCIDAISCTTPACLQESCPTQLAACEGVDAGVP